MLCCFGYDLFNAIIIEIKNNWYLPAMDTYLLHLEKTSFASFGGFNFAKCARSSYLRNV